MDSVNKFVLLENLDFSFSNCFKTGKAGPESINPVVGRLLHTLAAHRVSEVQLLSFVPKQWNWNLETVSSYEAFTKAINCDVLDWFAKAFAIEKRWLESGINEIQVPFWGYKDTNALKESLREEGWTKIGLRMSIMAENYTSKYGFSDRYLIVFSLPAFEDQNGDALAFKHRPFEWQWKYHHPPCYGDTMNISRWIHQLNGAHPVVPIIPVKRDDFERLINHEALIAHHWTNETSAHDHWDLKINLDSDQTGQSKLVK